MLQYYGGGIIDFDKEEIINIIEGSIFCKDNDVLNKAKLYITNHLTIKIFKDIINPLVKIYKDVLEDLSDVIDNFIRNNTSVILSEDNIILYSIETLQYIFNIKKIVFEDNLLVLNSLCKFYSHSNPKNNVNDEFKHKFKGLILKLNWSLIDKTQVSAKNKLIIKEYIRHVKGKNSLTAVIIPSGNKILDVFIMKYYNRDDIKFEEDDIERLKKEKIDNNILRVLGYKDPKINEIALLLIHILKLDVIIPYDIEKKVLDIILEHVINNEDDIPILCLLYFLYSGIKYHIFRGLYVDNN